MKTKIEIWQNVFVIPLSNKFYIILSLIIKTYGIYMTCYLVKNQARICAECF